MMCETSDLWAFMPKTHLAVARCWCSTMLMVRCSTSAPPSSFSVARLQVAVAGANVSKAAGGRARIGTSSLRRQAQIRHSRPDLRVEPVRGNVETRLRKLDKGDFDAIILASAGLKRLGLGERITGRLTMDECLPAVGQGVIGIECRSEDQEIGEALKLFAGPDTPVLIIISQEGDMTDYDRPTTAKKYLEYLKDQKKNLNEIGNIEYDDNGKIKLLELIKKDY